MARMIDVVLLHRHKSYVTRGYKYFHDVPRGYIFMGAYKTDYTVEWERKNIWILKQRHSLFMNGQKKKRYIIRIMSFIVIG